MLTPVRVGVQKQLRYLLGNASTILFVSPPDNKIMDVGTFYPKVIYPLQITNDISDKISLYYITWLKVRTN
jgi:hypothetical protein